MASVEKRIYKGTTSWVARWRDPDRRQRTKSFNRKVDADAFLATVTADMVRGHYVDPDAGKVTLKEYADAWLEAQTFDVSTYDATELRLRKHVYPQLGHVELRKITASVARSWIRSLAHLSRTYQSAIYSNVSSICAAAVDDDLIPKNPFSNRSVKRPSIVRRRIEPWTSQQVFAVRDALPAEWQVFVSLAVGLGLRQGEVFGLSPDDVDFLRGRVEVRRQVKVMSSNKLIFALPKGRKTRTVPLPSSVRDALAAHLANHPAQTVTLPYETKDGRPRSVPLILTTRQGTAANRNYFNGKVWKPALEQAGLLSTRENGTHVLRHTYASVLLNGGESIKAVSEYLGHADARFTLRVYTHLMPESDERTRSAIDSFGLDDDNRVAK
jgi:integrase